MKESNHIPIGFLMSLAQHQNAMKSFGQLSDGEQSRIIHYIQSAATGDEAKNRIQSAVADLEQKNSFLG